VLIGVAAVRIGILGQDVGSYDDDRAWTCIHRLSIGDRSRMATRMLPLSFAHVPGTHSRSLHSSPSTILESPWIRHFLDL
jgi:hypothetical protein